MTASSFISSLLWRSGILAALLYVLASLAVPDGADAPWQPTARADLGGAPPASDGPPQPTDRYADILKYPLFFADRQPWAPAERAQPASTMANLAEMYTLAGLAWSGEAGVAMLRPSHGGSLVTVRQGETLNGWTLQTIGPDGPRFVQAGQALILRYKPPGQRLVP